MITFFSFARPSLLIDQIRCHRLHKGVGHFFMLLQNRLRTIGEKNLKKRSSIKLGIVLSVVAGGSLD